MTPSADESVKFLTNKLRNREPFVFTKFGDGDLYWMSGNPVPIAGGETFRPGIDAELRQSARTLAGLPHVYFGDQMTCGSGPYMEREQDLYVRLPYDCDNPPFPTSGHVIVVTPARWLHFECLLIHRLSPELLEFYRVLKERREGTLLVSGSHLRLAQMLFAERYCTVDHANAHGEWEPILDIMDLFKWHTLLLSAGRASKMIAAALALKFPDRTIIELGSALDPLFVGRTRSEQVRPEDAREYFKELL